MKAFSTVFPNSVFFSVPLLVVSLLVPTVGQAARRTLDKSIVTVNDEVILESDIKAFQEKLKSPGFRDLFGNISDQLLKDRKAVVQLMVEEKIIDQQVKKLDLKASDMEIDRQIRVIAEKNGISQEQLKAQLKRLGTDFQDYRLGLKRQIERRNLMDREIRPTLEVSDEQLKTYYQHHHSKGKAADTKYHIAHIFVQGTSAPARKKVEALYQELKAHPEKFDTLVAESSDDASTSEHAGELGIFSLDSLSDTFKAAVPHTPAGSITPPLKAKEGYHIVKVLEARAGGFEDLTREEKMQLKNELLMAETEKKMAMWLERKKAEAHLRFAPDL